MRKLITGRTKYLILLLLFLAFESLSAQIYPVDITGMAIPPYSVKFYEYGTQGSEKFFINIRLNDIGELGRRVKLKIFLNGRGLNVSSKNYVQGAEAIYLDGGVNLRLTNNDLAPYFKYSNLNGMSSREYAGNLPTGFYKFGFQVFDYITNRPISLKFNIQMYIVLNSPPDLIAPKNEAQINYNEPPNIFFTWAPRHLNAMAARYEFTLKKIRYKGADPRQVFLSSPVYYQTETFTPSLVYGGGEPFLEEGMMYAWRVKAIVTTGISETSMFKNNGYSEIFWFTMLPQCEPPNMFETNNQNPDETKLTWEHFSGTSYKVEHRAPATDRNIANKSARNMKPSPWVMEKKTKKTEHLFSWNYQPDTDVEYRVGAECFPLSGYVWSEIQTFRTMSPEEKEEITKKRCEYRPASVVITDREPISLLRKGDFIYVRNYKVEIVQVTSQNNQHTGIGIAHGIPLFGQDSRMKMKFDNIKVNFAHQLIGGWVKSVYSEENWDKLEMNHEMGNIAETLKLLVNTVATMYETVEDLFNTGDITKKDLRTLKKALKQLEEDNDKLIVSREEAEELETLMNTALSEEQKERTQEKLDEINKEVAEISKTLVIDTEAMETRIAEIKAKAEKADASLYVQIKDKTHKYRRNETIYMVSQNKDLELIFGADVDSLMFAEAKWQLDGTSYQLPFLLD
ncbi:MAG: hypothetical protein HRT66_06105, partial [Flavobacteriaceae bacterium]|nr:hypothetical protein [Flavobacteriaceae bacterium]